MVAALRAHRDRQAFEQAAVGDRWQDSGLVFTSTQGTPVDLRNLIRSWHRVQRRQSDGLIERAYREANPIPTDEELAKAQMAELAPIQRDPPHPMHAAHGLARRNFYSTGHTAASLLPAEKVPVKVI